MTERIAAERLVAFIADAMATLGMPQTDAAEVGRLMVAADLAGFDGHGIFRLETYVARIKAGGLNLTPKFGVVSQSPATAIVDGDDGMGHLVAACPALRQERREYPGSPGANGLREGVEPGMWLNVVFVHPTNDAALVDAARYAGAIGQAVRKERKKVHAEAEES